MSESKQNQKRFGHVIIEMESKQYRNRFDSVCGNIVEHMPESKQNQINVSSIIKPIIKPRGNNI